jgi:RES domain-containing protein
MRLWRISNHASLSGDGGLYAAGRWHSRGRRIVYLADHPASALLEILVHLEVATEDLPSHYQLLGVEVSEDVATTAVEERELPPDWRAQPALTRARGDGWIAEGTSALLRVPSAIVPAGMNFLLNPAHPDATRIGIPSAERAAFDPRLMTFVKG